MLRINESRRRIADVLYQNPRSLRRSDMVGHRFEMSRVAQHETGLHRYRNESDDERPSRPTVWPCYEFVPAGRSIGTAIALLGGVGLIVYGYGRERRAVALLGIFLGLLAGFLVLGGHRNYCEDKDGNWHETGGSDSHKSSMFQQISLTILCAN
jgi:hypothetical protein